MDIKKITKSQFFENLKCFFVNSFLTFILQFVVSVIVVRKIGENLNGVVSYIYATIAIFWCVAEFGLDNILIREATKHKDSYSDIFYSVFVFRIIMSVVMMVGCTVYIWIKRHSLEYCIWGLVASSSFLGQSAYGFKNYFVVTEQNKKIFRLQNLVLILFSILLLAFAYFELPLIFYFAIKTAEVFAYGIVYLYMFRKDGIRFSFSKELLKSYLKEGIFLALAGLAVILYMKIDQIMVGDMLGEAVLGVYSVAVKMAELWYFIPTAIYSVVTPKMIQIFEKGIKEEIENKYSLYFRLMFDLAFLAGLVISLIAKYVLPLLYGHRFDGAIDVLKVYVWAGVFVCIGLARSAYLTYKKYNIFNASVTAIACILNIVLNYILINRIGEIGAAYSTVISYIFSALFSSLLWSKTRKVGIMQVKSIFVPYLLIAFVKKRKSAKD